jgi:hypothetical protein
MGTCLIFRMPTSLTGKPTVGRFCPTPDLFAALRSPVAASFSGVGFSFGQLSPNFTGSIYLLDTTDDEVQGNKHYSRPLRIVLETSMTTFPPYSLLDLAPL